MREEVSKGLKKIKSTMNWKMAEEIQSDENKVIIFEDVRDGSKQK